MYTDRLWTMRQYAGLCHGARIESALSSFARTGADRLSVAFDLPTQIGYDSDHPMAEGEVGRTGVAIDTLADFELLFEGIPLDKVSTSMTINATAAILLCMYIAVARKQGVAESQITGTVQNDILKEFIARGTYIYPPKPSMRLVTDIFAYAERQSAALQHDFDFGLSYSRGRSDRRFRRSRLRLPMPSNMSITRCRPD